MRGATPHRDREIDRHEEIASYLDAAWPKHLPWTHFPAGETRGDHVKRKRPDGSTYLFSPSGARLKRMGLKLGWLEFQFILPNGQFATAEVKRPEGSLSQAQVDHRNRCLALKCAYARWETPEDAAETITRWLAAWQLKPRCTLGEWRARQ